ncbi:hypothetical protein BC832DRAFT_566181 [Gaertneriomyces semiglobifer]|nr:hypothetical protein BC832DRAFT_566181 [Gaertneriomyces semiglobifer]
MHIISGLVGFYLSSTVAWAAGSYLGTPFLASLSGEGGTAGVPAYATLLPLPRASVPTKRYLTLLATLALQNSTVEPLLNEDKFQLPAFGKCTLPKDDKGVQPFQPKTQLDKYFANLFKDIESSTKGAIQLNRFDLWHGHLFANDEANLVGVLFHSKEYPAVSEEFPYSLGWCQANSTVPFSDAVMARRNLLWTYSNETPKLYWVDASKKTGDEMIDLTLGEEPFYTMWEDFLGKLVADFYFLRETGKVGVSMY